MAHLESELARFEAEIKAATAGAALPPPPIARSPQVQQTKFWQAPNHCAAGVITDYTCAA